MHRFFVEQKLQMGGLILKDDKLAHQLSRVLRLRAGEDIIFFNGDGFDYSARLKTVTSGAVNAEITSLKKNERELSSSLTVCLAMAHKERMEWAFEKCTEIGVKNFAPIITERTLVKNLDADRMRVIIKEAAEQSGRAVLPAYHEPAPFKYILAECGQKNALGILFDASYARSVSLAELSVAVHPYRFKSIYLFIGPEGGFTAGEAKEGESAGIKVARMYPTVLRSETAAVVFSALVGAMCVAS